MIWKDHQELLVFKAIKDNQETKSDANVTASKCVHSGLGFQCVLQDAVSYCSVVVVFCLFCLFASLNISKFKNVKSRPTGCFVSHYYLKVMPWRISR